MGWRLTVCVNVSNGVTSASGGSRPLPDVPEFTLEQPFAQEKGIAKRCILLKLLFLDSKLNPRIGNRCTTIYEPLHPLCLPEERLRAHGQG